MKLKLLSTVSTLCILATLSYAQTDREKMAMMQQQLNQLSERVEGLTTIIEGLNTTVNNLSMTSKTSASTVSLSVLKSRVDRIDKECHQKDTHKIQKNPTVKNKKDDTNDVVDRVISKDTTEKKSNATLYREGASYFQKQKYQKAEDIFEQMIGKGYKKASSNYYLGEIAYYTKNYADAIDYYKKSAKLYDKASYIDILLLHTAISLEKRGDKAQAKLFYETVVNDYPDKKSSKIARKNLKKL